VTLQRKRVLLTWEFGHGFGHAKRLALIGSRLTADGYDCRYILRYPEAANVVGIEALRVSSAPNWPKPDYSRLTADQLKREATRTLGQVLAAAAFGNAANILGIAERWEQIAREMRPDLVVADFSPSAVAAFRGRVPVVVVGEGYIVPPPHADSFPPLHDWTERELFAEDDVLSAIDNVQRRLGRAPLGRFVRIMQGDRNLVCSWRLLDPLARFRREPQIGFVAEKLPRPDGRPRDLVLAYIHSDALRHEAVRKLVANLPAPALAIVPGIAESDRLAISGSGTEVSREFLDLDEILLRSRAVIHQAGVGIASMALAAGVPQLALTSHIESVWTGHALSWVGAGLSATLEQAQAATELLDQLMANPAFAGSAMREAQRVATDYPRSALDVLAETCAELA
jgi:UDP:flavonoid glycosyltransferase YjiC (YdhE family)